MSPIPSGSQASRSPANSSAASAVPPIAAGATTTAQAYTPAVSIAGGELL